MDENQEPERKVPHRCSAPKAPLHISTAFLCDRKINWFKGSVYKLDGDFIQCVAPDLYQLGKNSELFRSVNEQWLG